jgi:hypothetical protein
MTSSQSSKQQQCNRQGHAETIEHLFALTATARFQANHIEQPSLRDLIRGSNAFPVTMHSPFHETKQWRVGGSGGVLNLMRIIDDALLVCSDNHDQASDGTESCCNSPEQFDQ